MRNNIRGFMKLRWYLCILENNRLAQSLKYRTGCAFCICQSWNPWLSLEHSFIIWKKIEIKEILFNAAWWIYGFFSESKLRTKIDTIRHCEERSDVAIHLSPFHNTCPLIQYRAIIKKGNAQTFGHLHVFGYCPIWTQDRYSVSDWGGHFFLCYL